jgi:cell shape-determining protein MreC
MAAALVPAQRGLVAVRRAGGNAIAGVRAQFTDAETVARREAESRQLAEENQRLKAELQAARDQVRLLAQRDSQDPSLLAAKCIPARILGTPAQAYLARHHLLDAGRASGVETDALVLQPATPLVDRGTQAGVADGNVVLAGSCVWGKIVSAGLHTSTVCPVTEPGFRDLVRLAATAPDGRTLRFGAKGILEGTGESLARLRMIETTEPVAEGDLVYSLAGQGFVETPLLCGRIVRVEAPLGAGHWEIWVAPAIDAAPDELAILCPTADTVDLARRPAVAGSE